MPENYPRISFNREGICNLCMGYEPREYLGKEKLIELLNSREKRGEYDCVVPLSGGKDSTYILYYATKELGLSCIAVSYDSGFQIDCARENVSKVCKKLGVPLVLRKSPGDVQSNLLREVLLLSRRLGFLLDVCGNCEVILRTVSIHVARAYEVPFVLWGSSALESHDGAGHERHRFGKREEVCLVPSSIKTRVFLKVLTKIFPRISANNLSNFRRVLEDPRKRIHKAVFQIGYHSVKYLLLLITQRVLMDVPLKYALIPYSVLPFTESNPTFVHFFNYVAWDSIASIKLLEDELDWKRPENRLARFDCALHSLGNYAHLKSFNISNDGVSFCNFVREKRMTREEAALAERGIQDSVDKECDEIRKRVGLRDLW